jgi:hypothetical protein
LFFSNINSQKKGEKYVFGGLKKSKKKCTRSCRAVTCYGSGGGVAGEYKNVRKSGGISIFAETELFFSGNGAIPPPFQNG